MIWSSSSPLRHSSVSSVQCVLHLIIRATSVVVVIVVIIIVCSMSVMV
jgi:hypothetical protein